MVTAEVWGVDMATRRRIMFSGCVIGLQRLVHRRAVAYESVLGGYVSVGLLPNGEASGYLFLYLQR